VNVEVGIIGAGAIGLSAAHYLVEAGVDVGVVDAVGPAGGASARNAGEICPDTIAPLQAPGIVRAGLRNLGKRDSSLYVHPIGALSSLAFMARFAKNSTPTAYQRGKQVLQEFAKGTHEAFADLAAGSHIDAIQYIDYLHVLSSTSKAAASRDLWMSRFDVTTSPVLDSDELHEREPLLGESAGGGFLLHGQAILDPQQYCIKLADSIERRGGGVARSFGADHIARTDDGYEVSGPSGSLRCRRLVLAAGVGTPRLLKMLSPRSHLPIYPGKGYSLSVPVPGSREVSHLLKLEEAYVAGIPYGASLRIAGTMEFDGRNPRYNAGRVEAIIRGARKYLDSQFDWSAAKDNWVGSRPMTPDGLPVIDKVPGHDGLVVASGHNMFGMMLAPNTAVLVKQLLLDEATAVPPAFRIDRY
jgi:D-amino-acid dehydrogenase